MGNFYRIFLLLCGLLPFASVIASEPLDLSRSIYGPYLGLFGSGMLGTVNVTGNVARTAAFPDPSDCATNFPNATICGITTGSTSLNRDDRLVGVFGNLALGYEVIRNKILFDIEGSYGLSADISSQFKIDPDDIVNVADKVAEQSGALQIGVVTGINLDVNKSLGNSFGGKVRLGYMINNNSALFGTVGYSRTKYKYKFKTPNETCVFEKVFDANPFEEYSCVPLANDARLLDIDTNLEQTISGKIFGLGLKNFISSNWAFLFELNYIRFDSIIHTTDYTLRLKNEDGSDNNTPVFDYNGDIKHSIELFGLNIGVTYSFHA